ncbi:TPA: methyltransferase [Candidatus Woesearchaeota archaeon]|nr:methyltransferase [Candidatus Woesearchaeota archaeon]HII68349.1 methyltransferase [Candidatus Woesearchaeota archaeon]
MDAIALTNKGITDIAALEVTELAKGKVLAEGDSHVSFSVSGIEDLYLLCYKAQAVGKIIAIVGSFMLEGNDAVTITKEVAGLDFSGWIPDRGTSFKAACIHTGEASSEELSAAIGEGVVKAVEQRQGFTPAVELKSPDVIIYGFCAGVGQWFIGVDVAGIDLSKRAYKIFGHPQALKGIIGYGLCRVAGIRDGQLIVDPFAGSGVIPIEAAHYLSGFAINHYNKQKLLFTKRLAPCFDFAAIDSKAVEPAAKIIGYDNSVLYATNAKKNAKIAGVEKYLKIARGDIAWLDTKCEEHSVDRIVTHPPQPSRHAEERIFEKTYREFFYQAEFVLKKDGRIACIMQSGKDLLAAKSREYGFSVTSEREVHSGMGRMWFIVFSRNPSLS